MESIIQTGKPCGPTFHHQSRWSGSSHYIITCFLQLGISEAIIIIESQVNVAKKSSKHELRVAVCCG